ncbi:MAG: DnaD domain protein [Dehalococcoidales bacterium]|nr:DnaD domain protein [Dehalococcoidales bacterium]
MKEFGGFPARMQFTSIPNLFFSGLLPEISNITELKTTLYIFWALYGKRGYPRFTTYEELGSNTSLMSSLKEGDKPADEVLRAALAMAVQRGTILHIVLDRDGTSEDIYFLNTETDRQVIAKIQSGEIILPGRKSEGQTPDVPTGPAPDIFTLYEENIGMLTPMIAEELKAAEKLYPEGWIEDAIKEAINQNKRKWSYISAILERWSAEGKSDGTYRRDSKTGTDKYSQQKYGHMVKR